MNSIPTSINIGGHTIQVLREAAVVDGDECYGTFDPKTLEITVDPDIPDSLALETFWHEVVEALNVFAETDLDHNHIQVFGLLLGQVAGSIFEDGKKPSHKARG